jgi:hypothetical protein
MDMVQTILIGVLYVIWGLILVGSIVFIYYTHRAARELERIRRR